MKPTMKKLPVVLTAIALAGQLSLPAAALVPLNLRTTGGSVSITEAFRDQNLQAWLLNGAHLGGAGADGILTEEERLAVTQLDLSGLGLTSLAGLDLFPNLQVLDCSRNNLDQLDLSHNPMLTELNCLSNRLTGLDLSANPELAYLNCNFNRIRALDLTGLRNLKALYCEMNQMEELNIAGCAELKTLYCRNNQLEQLLLTDNTKLEFIETFDNRLTSIDVSRLPNLRFLHIDHNRLTRLDMSHNNRLEGGGFVARNNFMEEIRLPVQPGLTIYLDDYEEQDPIQGYDRAAWFLDPDFHTPAPAELEAAGQTLYSQRIANRYTIYFAANGGNGSMDSLPTRWDTQAELPENAFQRCGYTFAGWNTQPKGDGAPYGAGAQVTNLAGAHTDGDRITLYAQWSPNSYTIRLDPNEGEGQVQSQSAVYGQTVNLPVSPFTNGDKKFAGWATEPQGSVRYSDGAEVRNLTAEAGGTITLYAVWRDSADTSHQAYLDQLDAAFQGYTQGDYTGQDWTVLTGAYTDAVHQIRNTSDTGVMAQLVEQARQAMAAVPTARDRVNEITSAWTADHAAALDHLSAHSLTESNAGAVGVLVQKALEGLTQDKLALYSTLTNETDRQQMVGLAAAQLQPQAEQLGTMSQSIRWVEGLGGLTTRPMEQVQEEHIDQYQSALDQYSALEPRLQAYISSGLAAGLEARHQLATAKRAQAQSIQTKYDRLDKSSYSAEGQDALRTALSSGLAAIRAAGSVEDVEQAGALAWNQMVGVPTLDQEPAVPPGNGGTGDTQKPTVPPSSGGSGDTQKPTVPPSSGGSGDTQKPTVPPSSGGSGDTQKPTVPPSSGGSGDTQKPTVPPSNGDTQEPTEETLTVTDDKTGTTAQVTTAADGTVTAQVTVPVGVAHGTLRIPCAGGIGTVAVRVLPDGTRQVLPRSVYRDGGLTVRVDGSCTIELTDGTKQFSDVTAGDWFADSVRFAASRTLFSGVGGGRFDPSGTMTRSMLVTVLHRLENCPAPASGGSFQDVPADTWYSAAANWAAEQGIAEGAASGRFDPDALLTRETMAVMLYRCAGRPTVTGGSLDSFRDGAQTSSWAWEAMEWACSSGILTGSSGNLRPGAHITRAEAAAMLTRFVTNTTIA